MLNIREMQIKTTVRYLTSWLLEQLSSTQQEITNSGEKVEKMEHFYTVCRIVNWCRSYRKLWWILKKLKVELPDDLEILLLGLHPK